MREIRGDSAQFDLLGHPLPTVQGIIHTEQPKSEEKPLRLTIDDLIGLPDDYLMTILKGVFNFNIPQKIRHAQNYSETLNQIYGAGKLKWGSFDFDKLPEDFFELNALLESTARTDLLCVERRLNFGYLKFNDPWKTRMEKIDEDVKKTFMSAFLARYTPDACAYEPKPGEEKDKFAKEVFQKLDPYILIN